MAEKDDDKTKKLDKDNADNKVALEEMNKMIKSLPANIQESFQNALANVAAAQPAAESAKEPDDDKDIDLEKLDRAGFAKYMSKTIVGEVNKLLKPVQDSIEQNSSDASKDKLKGAVTAARAKFDDFDEFKDGIIKLHKENPDTSPEDLYHLAKAHNPDKVAELAKVAGEKKTEDDKKTKDETETVFGGFFPTGITGDHGDKEGKMSADDAADDAWEKAMKDVPASMFQT